MKKILNVLVFCGIIVGFTFFFWKNPDFTNKIGNEIRQNVFATQVPAYSTGVEVNSLQIEKADYYYNLLTAEQKRIYDSIANSVKNLNTSATVSKYSVISEEDTMNDVAEAMDAFFNDHPEVFYLSTEYKVATSQTLSGYNVEIMLEFFVSGKAELDEKISEIEKIANDIIMGVDKRDVFKTELAIHDNLSKITRYYSYTNEGDIPKETHSIYGTLISKTAVCDGFTKTMQILLDKVGIQSILVSGILQGEAHAWNMVCLNGEWYHMDLTSDKSLYKYSDKSNITIHSYFNINTAQIKETHIINKEDDIPTSTETKYNYYIYTDRYISNYDNFTTMLKNIFSKDAGSDVLEFATNNTSIAVDRMSEVLQDTKYAEYRTTNTNSFKYYNILNTYIITK